MGLGLPVGSLGFLGTYRPLPNLKLFVGVGLSLNTVPAWLGRSYVGVDDIFVFALGGRAMTEGSVRPYFGTSMALSGYYKSIWEEGKSGSTIPNRWERTLWLQFDFGLEVDGSDALYVGTALGGAIAVNPPTHPAPFPENVSGGRTTPSMGLMFGARLF